MNVLVGHETGVILSLGHSLSTGQTEQIATPTDEYYPAKKSHHYGLLETVAADIFAGTG